MAPPNPYYDLVRESRMSEKLRLRMVRFAKKEGVKPIVLTTGKFKAAGVPGTKITP